MKRWIVHKNVHGKNERIDAFIADVIDVCKRHGFSISHEDAHGAFEITPFNQREVDWFTKAHDNTGGAK